jgi:hypothetical protein
VPLPKQWIEERFGVEPDGGNGAIELFLTLVPIGMGMTLLLTLAARHTRAVKPKEQPSLTMVTNTTPARPTLVKSGEVDHAERTAESTQVQLVR